MADKKDGATAVAEKIASWPANYTEVGARISEIVAEVAPDAVPKMFYGGAGYARAKTAPVLFQFRYDPEILTISFTEKAELTVPGQILPSAWYLQLTEPKLEPEAEATIADVVRRVFA